MPQMTASTNTGSHPGPRQRHACANTKAGLATGFARDAQFANSAPRHVVARRTPPLLDLTSLLLSVRGYAQPGGAGPIRSPALRSHEGRDRRHPGAGARPGIRQNRGAPQLTPGGPASADDCGVATIGRIDAPMWRASSSLSTWLVQRPSSTANGSSEVTAATHKEKPDGAESTSSTLLLSDNRSHLAGDPRNRDVGTSCLQVPGARGRQRSADNGVPQRLLESASPKRDPRLVLGRSSP
jgi:hypothetical protein